METARPIEFQAISCVLREGTSAKRSDQSARRISPDGISTDPTSKQQQRFSVNLVFCARTLSPKQPGVGQSGHGDKPEKKASKS
jgi:hypothetical protein